MKNLKKRCKRNIHQLLIFRFLVVEEKKRHNSITKSVDNIAENRKIMKLKLAKLTDGGL